MKPIFWGQKFPQLIWAVALVMSILASRDGFGAFVRGIAELLRAPENTKPLSPKP